MILYIWKIIDLPYISTDDLIYRLSFEMFLFSPHEAQLFVKKAIQKGTLTVDDNHRLSLSDALVLELENWHRKREEEILKNIKSTASINNKIESFKKDSLKKFNILLKAFLDTGTINRAVLVSDSSILLTKFDPQNGLLKAEIKGSRDTPYIIEISTTEKIVKHDCHDFQTKRAQDKKFCKHLTKLFLLLKEKDEKEATTILEKMSKEINKWSFES
ncbi:MAG: hypothetical protein EAX91_04940 [Candidatus Lokiarchaeota archaeon]|nr:hypothetical protein [Candidatus Lokiarchaeota archaeon]